MSEKPSDAGVDLVVVTMRFRANAVAQKAGTLAAVLSHYVVVTRGSEGCRNVDFCVSVADPRVFVVLQKWASPASQEAHFNSAEMIGMAEACNGLLCEAPQIDLLEGISAHDLA